MSKAISPVTQVALVAVKSESTNPPHSPPREAMGRLSKNVPNIINKKNPKFKQRQG